MPSIGLWTVGVGWRVAVSLGITGKRSTTPPRNDRHGKVLFTFQQAPAGSWKSAFVVQSSSLIGDAVCATASARSLKGWGADDADQVAF